MAIVNGYSTLAEFKAYLTARGSSASSDTADDGVIEDLITAVSRHIDALTGRHFYKDTTDATRYFQAKDNMVCDVMDLVSVTTLSVDYSNDRTYTALTASTEFELEPVNAALDGKPYSQVHIVETSGAYFPTTRRGVKIVGKFGWPAVPADIKNDCLAILLNVYANRSGQSSFGRISVTASGVVIRPEDIPPLVMANLLTYRIYL